MPNTAFETLALELETLIDEAREAVLSGDVARMKAAHAALSKFSRNSNDLVPGVIELDTIAGAAMRDVTLARLDKSLVQELSTRSAEIARLTKMFSTQAALNNSAAASLRLERVKAVLDAGTTAVAELKKLVEVIDDDTTDGQKLAATLREAISAFSTVQKQLAK